MHPSIEKAKQEGRPLLETEALGLLSSYGIPVPAHHFVRTEKEALEASQELGGPVVLKVVSPDIVHKTEAGGVILHLKGKREIARAFHRLISLREAGHDVHGVLVCPHQDHEIELSCGLFRDAQFGPVITFGLGGIWIEVLRDISYGIAPLSRDEAAEMIGSIRGRAVLEGLRGKRPVDREALAGMLVRLSEMSLKEEGIRELDLNPIFPVEKGLFIADARIIV